MRNESPDERKSRGNVGVGATSNPGSDGSGLRLTIDRQSVGTAQTPQGIKISATNLDEHATYRIENNPGDGCQEAMLVPFERLNRILKGSSSKEKVKFAKKDDHIAVGYIERL